MSDKKDIVQFIRNLYSNPEYIPLHAPIFHGNEKKYLEDCIDSNFVSSVGKYVDRFEEMVCKFTGSRRAVAVVNGTSALQVALELSGVDKNTEVITQSLTFVATCNAISYLGADPVFVDVDKDTMGLSPESLKIFLEKYAVVQNGNTCNKKTGRKLAACVPMHTYGHPVRIKEIVDVCTEYDIPVVEDAAESIGSYIHDKHTGRFGRLGILSFNGNKNITTGGGGMIITDDSELGDLSKHITTTAKTPHPWEFYHDMTGYNFRLPNINAALGCAQMEKLPEILRIKRDIAKKYADFFADMAEIDFVNERYGTMANYWLNTVIVKDREARDSFLEYTNANGVMTRPIWTLMNRLPMYRDAFRTDLTNSEWLEDRVVCIPSGVPPYLL